MGLAVIILGWLCGLVCIGMAFDLDPMANTFGQQVGTMILLVLLGLTLMIGSVALSDFLQ